MVQTATATKTSARSAYVRVQAQVERIVNSDPHSMHTFEVGDEWRQGDVRVKRLPDDFDFGEHCRLLGEVPVQLAPGTTLGSRHTLDSTEGVTAYSLKHANALDGPLLRLTEPRSLLHPEHGDCVDLPPGNYAFPGQRVYADEVRRTID